MLATACTFNNKAFNSHVLHLLPTSKVDSHDRGPTGRKITHGHRLWVNVQMLSSVSGYFASLFGSRCFLPGEETKLVMEDAAVDHMADLVRFVYTGEIQTEGEEALARLLVLADKSEMPSAVAAVVGVLVVDERSELSVAASSIFLQLAATLSHKEQLLPLLRRSCDRVLSFFERFDETWQGSELLTLSPAAWTFILDNDRLIVGSENTVFCALRRWAWHNIDERGRLLGSLFPLIRYPLMSLNFLIYVVERDDLIQRYCMEEIIQEAKSFLIERTASASHSLHKPKPTNTPPSNRANTTITTQQTFRSLSSNRSPKKTSNSCSKRYVRRALAPNGGEAVFHWEIEDVFSLSSEGRRSKSFFLNGYFFYLVAKVLQDELFSRPSGHTKQDNAPLYKSRLALYLCIDEAPSGLGQTYYIDARRSMYVRDYVTNTYFELGTNSSSFHSDASAFAAREWRKLSAIAGSAAAASQGKGGARTDAFLRCIRVLEPDSPYIRDGCLLAKVVLSVH